RDVHDGNTGEQHPVRFARHDRIGSACYAAAADSASRALALLCSLVACLLAFLAKFLALLRCKACALGEPHGNRLRLDIGNTTRPALAEYLESRKALHERQSLGTELLNNFLAARKDRFLDRLRPDNAILLCANH